MAQLVRRDLTHLSQEAIHPVGREAHHLVLFAESVEADELADRRVVDAGGVRPEGATQHVDARPLALCDEGTREIAGAVRRDACRPLEVRAEERARRVGHMVLDLMKRSAHVGSGGSHRLRHEIGRRRDLSVHAQSVERTRQTLHGMARDERGLSRHVCPRIARDRNVGQVLQARSGKAEDLPHRELREARAVFLAAQPLFGDGGENAALAHEYRGGIGVGGVDA